MQDANENKETAIEALVQDPKAVHAILVTGGITEAIFMRELRSFKDEMGSQFANAEQLAKEYHTEQLKGQGEIMQSQRRSSEKMNKLVEMVNGLGLVIERQAKALEAATDRASETKRLQTYRPSGGRRRRKDLITTLRFILEWEGGHHLKPHILKKKLEVEEEPMTLAQSAQMQAMSPLVNVTQQVGALVSPGGKEVADSTCGSPRRGSMMMMGRSLRMQAKAEKARSKTKYTSMKKLGSGEVSL